MAEKRYPSQRAEQFVIRFEAEGIRDRLKELAALNRRSLNAEINARLSASLAAEKEKASTATLGS
jgi:plasmid stability protein